MKDVLLYLDNYTDEVVPCAPNLRAIADWLSKPDRNWGRFDPAKSGEVFAANAIVLWPDVILTRTKGGWVQNGSEPPTIADFFAIRRGRGKGWDAENICASIQDAQIRLNHGDLGPADVGEVFHIAVGVHLDGLKILYETGPRGPECRVTDWGSGFQEVERAWLLDRPKGAA